MLRLLVIALALHTAAGTSPLAAQAAGPAPVAIGDRIAGSFGDATGHSAQSHLIYAANSRVWWLFTLTSSADSEGGSDHVIKSFRSSGPDLATATWTPGADSPSAAASAPNQFLGGGRSLGIAYVNNSPVDVIHADMSMAFDGQDGRTGHIRAVVTGTSITWASWNFFDEPAATWTLPRGNTIGVSTGKFIHTGGPILQQEVDANARKSTNADTGSTWTTGFSVPVVIDGSMLNQDNALAFAPLANNVMLAVYDNGQNVEPNQTNLRYKRSNTNGTWPGIVVGSQLGGDGNVFSTNAVIDQNDWCVVPVTTSQIHAFRRKANGSGIDAAAYNVVTNSWSAMSPAPPLLGAGQSVKSGAGLFGATDGRSLWAFIINTDLANTILYSRFDGAAWTAWAVVPGTEIGIQNRNYISGSPQVGNNQIGLIWTEGTSLFDVVVTSLVASPDAKPPTVSLTTPADGAIVSGIIPIAASASDNVGVAGVQFWLDGVDFGPEVAGPPYSTSWNTAASANGAHVLTAIARDEAGNTATASAVSVTVANTAVVPDVVGLTRTAATASIVAAGLTLGTVTQASSATVPFGSVISQMPSGGTEVAANAPVDLVVSSGPPLVIVPNVVDLTQAAATAAIASAGLIVGTVTTASSTIVPAGSVISQTPVSGTRVASGSAVALVVSSGTAQVAVPNVVGLTQTAATTAITNAGLIVGTVTTASSTVVPAGSVISQTPASATQVAGGSTVSLVVSSGPAQVAVPNVVGLTQAAATTAIANAGLIVGTVTAASSTTVPPGSVISQTPASGTQVASGSAIALVVSSGPPQVAVPNVVGLTQAAAAAAITSAGLIVGTVTTVASTTVIAGLVVSQDPPAGTGIAAASAVDLIISSGAGTPAGIGPVAINFLGLSTATMDASESAGVVPQTNWNNAVGSVRSTPLALVDAAGAPTAATVTWTANNGWMTSIVDQPGNARLMKGYLDNINTSVTTVTVTGLPSGDYDVYVYTDGDNKAYRRTAAYRISGPGIAETTIEVLDPPSTNFSGTFSEASGTSGNYVKFRISSTGFTITALPGTSTNLNVRAPVNGIQIVPATVVPAPSAIGINFLGISTAMMADTERAGVVPQTHWNNAAGSVRSTPLVLVDDAGAPTTATVVWTANNGWMTSIVDQPGNARLMKGYLDNINTSVTTVTAAGLPQGDYDVYVYTDGDNKAYSRTSSYQISGPGITTATVGVLDPPSTNFSGTFTEAAGTSGNYVRFRINGSGFTLSALPGTSTNVNVRAPVNGIQIVRSTAK